MIYNYKGIRGCDCKCDIEIRENIVIATELKENPGTSITNWAEHLANDITEQYSIPKEKLVWLECYDHLGIYAIVEFELRGNVFVNPQWKHCTKAVIDKIADGKIVLK